MAQLNIGLYMKFAIGILLEFFEIFLIFYIFLYLLPLKYIFKGFLKFYL